MMNIKSKLSFMIIASLLCFAVQVLYSIYGRRGRLIGQDDAYITIADYKSKYVKSKDVLYSIRKLGSDSVYAQIKNNSLQPYYFWLYEYEGWESSLPPNVVFAYASRATIYYGSNIITDKHTASFDCGSGLGVTIIWPLESFEIAISVSDLSAGIQESNFLKQRADGEVVDLINGTTYNLLTTDRENLRQRLVEDDHWLDIEFNLPVISFFDHKHSVVKSNKIRLLRSSVL